MSLLHPVLKLRFVRLVSGCCLIMAISACGGEQDSKSPTTSRLVSQSALGAGSDEFQSTPATPNPSTIRLQREGARLNTAELEGIAKTGVLPRAFEGPLLSGADTTGESAPRKSLDAVRKSAVSRVPVYRFFNTRTSAHFYTNSPAERDNIRATQPFMTYEGAAFYASSTSLPGLSPVHRFYNPSNGVHFYTISESERAHIASTLPTFAYEGIAYYASTLPGTGYTPLYRFFYTARGFHFFTTSRYERDNIMASQPQYAYEGIAYYALDDTWQTPAIPHTGVTSGQCYQAGSDALVACSGAGARALNRQQDGQRSTDNSLSYSEFSRMVFTLSGVPITTIYPITSCVKDNVTGMLWEGKEASGPRMGSIVYTNFGGGRSGDASAYVNTVNAMNLCGYSDWRLPTVDELQGLMHYGMETLPTITRAWFPNTPGASRHWTSNASAIDGANNAWTFELSNFSTSAVFSRTNLASVRLVRGAPWSGLRYLVGSAFYPGDGTNNVIIDRKTGLSWRRCLEGQSWNGGSCLGTSRGFTHEGALAYAMSVSGWRLPNIKELNNLVSYERLAPAISLSSFPGLNAIPGSPGNIGSNWSSTPFQAYLGTAFTTNFFNGNLERSERSLFRTIRLVMSD